LSFGLPTGRRRCTYVSSKKWEEEPELKRINLVANNYGNAFDGTSELAAGIRDALQRRSNIHVYDRWGFISDVLDEGFKLPDGLTHFLYIESIWWRLYPYLLITVPDLYPIDPIVTGRSEVEFSGVWKGLEHLGEAKHLLPLSRVGRDQLSQFLHVEPKKMTVVPPILGEEYVPLRELRPKDNKCVIGMINHVEPPWDTKMTPFLAFVKIFKECADRELELHLYGRYDPACLEAAKGDERISFFGPVPWTAIVLRHNQFSAYLSTSKIEGFGYPIMKSKKCEVPVLCYDGKLDPHVKQNTCIWNEETLPDILKNRNWEKIDLAKAREDTKWCSEDAVVNELLKVYERFA
jgi:hypothetical protein